MNKSNNFFLTCLSVGLGTALLACGSSTGSSDPYGSGGEASSLECKAGECAEYAVTYVDPCRDSQSSFWALTFVLNLELLDSTKKWPSGDVIFNAFAGDGTKRTLSGVGGKGTPSIDVADPTKATLNFSSTGMALGPVRKAGAMFAEPNTDFKIVDITVVKDKNPIVPEGTSIEAAACLPVVATVATASNPKFQQFGAEKYWDIAFSGKDCVSGQTRFLKTTIINGSNAKKTVKIRYADQIQTGPDLKKFDINAGANVEMDLGDLSNNSLDILFPYIEGETTEQAATMYKASAVNTGTSFDFVCIGQT